MLLGLIKKTTRRWFGCSERIWTTDTRIFNSLARLDIASKMPR